MAQVWKLVIVGGTSAETAKIILPTTTDHRDIRSISSIGGEILILYEEKNGACMTTEIVSVNQETGKRVASDQAASYFFKSKEISDTFGNCSQNFVVEKCGKVYGWGSNDYGQLGIGGGDAVISIPTCLPLSKKEMVAQVACGESHTLILAKTGKLYAMGDNAYGQLGLNLMQDERKAKCEPNLIKCLQDLPISQIVAGKEHSLCVTISGRVFSWGRNDFGQLGLGTTSHTCTPKQIKDLNKPIAYISAGDNHNAILTRAGELFTFGLGADGQLGHGDRCENEVIPKVVKELEGSKVTQVACGKSHTVAYVPGCEQAFAFGCNTNGQLGFDRTKLKLVEPTMIRYSCHDDKSSKIERIFAFGNRTCFVLISSLEKLPHDCRYIERHRRILTLDEISKLLTCEEYDTDEDDTIAPLQLVMTSASCLNGSFVASDDRVISHNFHGIDFDSVRPAVEQVFWTGNLEMKEAVSEALSKYLLPSLRKDVEDVEMLKIYAVLPMCFEILLENWVKEILPEAIQTAKGFLDSVVFDFMERFLELFSQPMSVLKNWYATLSPEVFMLSIKLCKRAIQMVIDRLYTEQSNIRFALKFLQLLKEINSQSQVVNYKEFYIPNFPPNLLEVHFDLWKQNQNPQSLLSYPFLLDAKAKNFLLHVGMNRRDTGISVFGIPVPQLPNILIVDRKNVVSGAVKQIDQFKDLRRPLQVRFTGEEGIDDGALSKEFFMLAFREILDPSSGLFTECEDSNLLWFTKHQQESESLYNFVGILCGLSLYNNAIAYLNFPLALYKKLLGVEPNLNDLRELNPPIGSSLEQILDFAEDEEMTVEEAFDLVFTTPEGIALREGGEHMPVTVKNRKEYVRLYVDYVFQKSVRLQFDAFCNGFLKACEDKILDLFRPEELMEMVAGVRDYDWDELKQNTKYKPIICQAGGFDPLHPTIIWFWEVLLDMSPEEKRKFLLFLTGSDKIPLTGLHMTIFQREECDDFLPVAQVCYNYLHLHSYSSKKVLEERLKLSILCEGFHIK